MCYIFTLFHFTVFYFTVSHSVSVHCVSLCFISLCFISLCFISLCFISMGFISLFCSDCRIMYAPSEPCTPQTIPDTMNGNMNERNNSVYMSPDSTTADG